MGGTAEQHRVGITSTHGTVQRPQGVVRLGREFQHPPASERERAPAVQLARRLVFTEWPEAVPEPMRQAMSARLQSRIADSDSEKPWMTVDRAFTEIKHAGADRNGILAQYRTYLEGLSSRVSG